MGEGRPHRQVRVGILGRVTVGHAAGVGRLAFFIVVWRDEENDKLRTDPRGRETRTRRGEKRMEKSWMHRRGRLETCQPCIGTLAIAHSPLFFPIGAINKRDDLPHIASHRQSKTSLSLSLSPFSNDAKHIARRDYSTHVEERIPPRPLLNAKNVVFLLLSPTPIYPNCHSFLPKQKYKRPTHHASSPRLSSIPAKLKL